jgi:protein TonB
MRLSISNTIYTVLVAALVWLPAATSLAKDAQPVELKRVEPIYPPDLRRGNIEGKVEVEFIVDENGDVEAARIHEESANERWQFRFSAVVAVWQWKFQPGIKDDKPVRTLLRVPVVFSLNK